MEEPELLDALLGAEDRDHVLARRPVVSYHDEDEPEYLDALDALALERVELVRRGVWHGLWAELDPARLGDRAPAAGDAGVERERWERGRPVTLRVFDEDGLAQLAPELEHAEDLRQQLSEAGGLGAYMDEYEEELQPEFRRLGRPARMHDPERDIDCELFSWRSSGPGTAGFGEGRKRAEGLWLKSGWLSTHDEDPSLRLRVSFGREGPDDASRDLFRHRLVSALAERLIPCVAALHESAHLRSTLERLALEQVFFTQHIAYWNCPGGGSLLHHDAFDEDPLGRQLGVCYVQLSGRTAWIAISLSDLAERVREFADFLGEGEMPWVKEQLYGDKRQWQRMRKTVYDDALLRRELARPGCGRLAPLVGRGPEFTSFLADAGHGVLLSPGEAVLLPNLGLRETAMHSVFCASDGPTYGLSLAVRGERAPDLPDPEEEDEVGGRGAPPDLPPQRRRRRGRR